MLKISHGNFEEFVEYADFVIGRNVSIEDILTAFGGVDKFKKEIEIALKTPLHEKTKK